VRRKTLETLIAEIKRSYALRARLGTQLAHPQTSGSLTGTFVWERGGMASLHTCHLAKATGKTEGPTRSKTRPPLEPVAARHAADLDREPADSARQGLRLHDDDRVQGRRAQSI
jgi:hypothetical protein